MNKAGNVLANWKTCFPAIGVKEVALPLTAQQQKPNADF